MTLCIAQTLVWVIIMAAGSLATDDNTTNATVAPTTEPPLSPPENHLPFDPASTASLAAGVSIAVIIAVAIIVIVSCVGIYQLCSYFDQV